MAATVSGVAVVFDGAVRVRYATVTLDSSYLTSGEPLAASDFGLYNILALFPAGAASTSLYWDQTNGKILAYGTNTNTVTATTLAVLGLRELVSTTNLSTMAFQALVVGN